MRPLHPQSIWRAYTFRYIAVQQSRRYTRLGTNFRWVLLVIWRSVLTVLSVAVIGVGLSLASGIGSGKVDVARPADLKQVHSSGCQVVVDGQVVQLQPEESIRVGSGWRNCQNYDGHPVVIYSSEPPKAQSLDLAKLNPVAPPR